MPCVKKSENSRFQVCRSVAADWSNTTVVAKRRALRFPGSGKINKSLNFEFASKPDSFTDNKNDSQVLLTEGPVICVNDDSDEGVVCVIFRRRCRDAFCRLLEPTLALQRRRRRWRRRPGSEPAAHRRRLWRLRTGTLSGQTEIKVWNLDWTRILPLFSQHSNWSLTFRSLHL